MSVLLPTPLPAKRPTRCPAPKVVRASSARTPVANFSVMRGRVIGPGGSRITSHRSPSILGPPSMGWPRPSSTRPSRPREQRIESGSPVGRTASSGPIPSAGPKGIKVASSSTKPTTCARSGPERRSISTISPTRTPGMAARMLRPIRDFTRPRTCTVSAWSRRPRSSSRSVMTARSSAQNKSLSFARNPR